MAAGRRQRCWKVVECSSGEDSDRPGRTRRQEMKVAKAAALQRQQCGGERGTPILWGKNNDMMVIVEDGGRAALRGWPQLAAVAAIGARDAVGGPRLKQLHFLNSRQENFWNICYTTDRRLADDGQTRRSFRRSSRDWVVTKVGGH